MTITGWNCEKAEPNAEHNHERLHSIYEAKEKGINTWVSCEPVLDKTGIYQLIMGGYAIDRFKIGKLNYHPSDINWAEFGREAERLCRLCGHDYYIKDSLRREMGDGEQHETD